LTWYQNVEGVEGAVFKDPRRKDSRFWGEGKWNTYIKPLLPENRQTFIELGCNAGLFLKLAMDAGFKNVIGVEASQQRMQQAYQYRESNGYPYRLVHQKVGEFFGLEQLPLADVTLISNMHYYLPVGVFSNLADRLRSRSMYCLIVSAKARRRQGCARHYLESVRGYFRDWQEVEVVGDWQGKDGLVEDDPTPRKQMYSVLFKGGLETRDTEAQWQKSVRDFGGGPDRLEVALGWRSFFRDILDGEEVDLKHTFLYQYYKNRDRAEWILDRLEEKAVLALNVQANGMMEPIYMDRKNRVLDGMHRLNLAAELGYKHILVREL
jgi:hypothetical protein